MKDGPAKQKASAFVNHAPKSAPISNKEPCSICLEVPVGPATLDSCEHSYCYGCILEWSKNSNTCPLCKRRFHKVAKVMEEKEPTKKRQRISVQDESFPSLHKKHKASHESNSDEEQSAFQFPKSQFALTDESSESDDIQESATVIPDRDLRDSLHHPPPTFSLVERLLDLDAWRRIAMTRALNAHVSVLQFPMPTLGQTLGRVMSDILSPPGRRRRQREFREVNGVIDLTQEIEVINSDSSSDEENEEAVPADDPLTNLGLLLQTLMNRRNANGNNGNENNQNNANHQNNNNNNHNNFRMNQEPEVIDLRDSSEEEPDEGDVTSELLLV